MTGKPLTRVVGRIKTIKAKASRSLARRGESNVLWLIVSVIGVVIGLVILFTVAHGVIPSLNAGNALTVSAEELGGVLTVNIKAAGVSAVTIKAISLSPNGASASSCTAYLNGNQHSGITSLPAPSSSTSSSSSSSSPTSLYSGLVTLKPGDTLSIVCTSTSGSPTEVVVVTTTGTYITPIS